MKHFLFFFIAVFTGCSDTQKVYAPIHNTAEKSKANVSKERAKNLNNIERKQI